MAALGEKGLDVRETAIFRGDDPDCLVDAGLACRACLSGEVEWAIEIEPWEDRAPTRCRRCGHRRVVALTPEQALRLSLRSGSKPAPAAPTPRSGMALVV